MEPSEVPRDPLSLFHLSLDSRCPFRLLRAPRYPDPSLLPPPNGSSLTFLYSPFLPPPPTVRGEDVDDETLVSVLTTLGPDHVDSDVPGLSLHPQSPPLPSPVVPSCGLELSVGCTPGKYSWESEEDFGEWVPVWGGVISVGGLSVLIPYYVGPVVRSVGGVSLPVLLSGVGRESGARRPETGVGEV